MMSVEEWYEQLKIIEAKETESVAYFYVMYDWEPDEVLAAEYYLRRTFGYPITIFTGSDKEKGPDENEIGFSQKVWDLTRINLLYKAIEKVS